MLLHEQPQLGMATGAAIADARLAAQIAQGADWQRPQKLNQGALGHVEAPANDALGAVAGIELSEGGFHHTILIGS